MFCKNITLSASCMESTYQSELPIQKVSTYKEEVSDYAKKLAISKTNHFCDSIIYHIGSKNNQLIAYLKHHIWEISDSGSTKSLAYSLRGRLLYEPINGLLIVIEWIKTIGLMIKMPLGIVIAKIIAPLIYALVKVFRNVEAFDRAFQCEHAWKNLTPLKSLLTLLIHPLLLVPGLIPGCSAFFNKLSGDLERWENGHTAFDLQAKSLGRRCREALYIAPCQQPHGALTGEISGNLNLTSTLIHRDLKRSLLRQIVQQDYTRSSVSLILEENGE